MKKIFTLLSAVALSVASFMMSAAPMQIGNFKGELKPEIKAALQSKSDAVAFASEFNSNFNNGSNVATRVYVDKNNNVWTTQFLATGMKGTDAFQWTDKETGEPTGGPDWNEYPIYASYLVFAIIECTGADGTDKAVQYAMFWPSHYLWDQQETYTGDLDENNQIPIEFVDFDIVPFDELVNTGDFCKTFIEWDNQGYPFPEVNDAGTAYISYPLIYVDGYLKKANAQKILSVVSGYDKGLIADIDFNSADDNYVSFNATIAGVAEDNTQINDKLLFEGTCRIDGFAHKNITYPKLGGIHIFDCGEISSAALGFATPWSEDFDPLQKFMVWGYDEYLKFMINEGDVTNTTNNELLPAFDWRDDIENPQGTSEDHMNYFRFIMYSPKGTSMKGIENIWTMTFPTVAVDDFDGEEYISYCPTANCVIPYESQPQGCLTEGCVLMYHNYDYYPTEGTQVGFGTDNGFCVYIYDDYDNFMTIAYTDDVYYHNDPQDCNKYEMISPVGSKKFEPSGAVEEVSAEDAVVNAANGVVTVAGDVDVKIYTVAGAMVANKKVNGAASFNLGNGLFIVKAGNVTKKVML